MRNRKEFNEKINKKTYEKSSVEPYKLYQKLIKELFYRDEFLSLVSHKLRTPLTTMYLTLYAIRNSIENSSLSNSSLSELRGDLKNFKKQIESLTLMLNELFDISLINTGKIQLNLEKNDLTAITTALIKTNKNITKAKRQQLEIDTNSSVFGNFDKLKIEQVIRNLLSNALKYGEGKKINIKCFNKKNKAYFVISDQGVGISKKDQKYIFDLFKEPDWSGQHATGLGVGLYITSQIVKAHKGKIKVASEPLHGATFTVELPVL